MNIVILGLSISSGAGNSYAATFRGLVKALDRQNHQVLLLEREVPWHTSTHQLADPDYGENAFYTSLEDLKARFTEHVEEADMVLVSSVVPEGASIGKWMCSTAKGIKAFYDLDTPATLTKLKRGEYQHLHPTLIPKYDLYLSSSGGPTLALLERTYGSPMARAMYSFFDPTVYYPEFQEVKWDMGYLGAYSGDRQPYLDKLMLEAARKWVGGSFLVAGPNYPESIEWPANTTYVPHLPPAQHRKFYNSQRFTQVIMNTASTAACYAPSTRLFEAAACGTPIISNYCEGMDTIFETGAEVLVSYSAKDTLGFLLEMCKSERKMIGELARKKVLSHHTAGHRAKELISYAEELMTLESTDGEEMLVS